MHFTIHRQVGCGKHLSSSIPSNKIISDKYKPMLGKYPNLGLEWPNLHDYISFVLDKFMFTPITRSYVSIEVGPIFCFISPTYKLPITKHFPSTHMFHLSYLPNFASTYLYLTHLFTYLVNRILRFNLTIATTMTFILKYNSLPLKYAPI
jgi:hypothetical protein